jgi:hypothetical protein
VISAFNQSNPDYLEITEPVTWTPTVDAEVVVPETKETDGRSEIGTELARGCGTNRGSTEVYGR